MMTFRAFHCIPVRNTRRMAFIALRSGTLGRGGSPRGVAAGAAGAGPSAPTANRGCAGHRRDRRVPWFLL